MLISTPFDTLRHAQGSAQGSKKVKTEIKTYKNEKRN